MSFEIIGKLIVRFDIVQRSETFKTREFVIETTDDNSGKTFTSYIKFQCVQDKTAMPDRFNLGDEVKVQFNIRGTKWEKEGRVNYITNLDAWKMESVKLSQDNANTSFQQHVDAPLPEDSDDLPF